MLSEFELIAQYFKRPLRADSAASLGIGDDCALLAPAPGMQLAVSCDMLVEGRHFFPDVDVQSLGHKALAVNLSDLAAMGAKPLAFTLALALPDASRDWLAAFSSGLFALAQQHGCELIGGDTTRGPLNICITVFGEVPAAQALRRCSARAGDDIWVSGTLGAARLALAAYRNELTLDSDAMALAAARMHRPTPRVALGNALRGIANAAIDVSDGLCGDLSHILAQSALGATLDVDALPVAEVLQQQAIERRRQFSLAGGDDYELCFTAASNMRAAVLQAALDSGTAVTRIGRIDQQPGLRLTDGNGQAVAIALQSFDHFRT